jgi:lysozyme family protein
MGHEGHYANDPDDRGGETWKGVARNFHPSWGGWQIIDSARNTPGFPHILKNDKILEQEVQDFYELHFWREIMGHDITEQIIANELFDTAVNMGPETASRFLQRLVNALNNNQRFYKDIVVDGAIGQKTLSALTHCLEHNSVDLIYKILNVLQGNRYIEIMEGRQSQEKWARIWFTRVKIEKR